MRLVVSAGRWSCVVASALLAACFSPSTYEGEVDPSVVEAEALLQQQLVLQSLFSANERVQRLAWDFQRVLADRCPQPAVGVTGAQLATRRAVEREMQAAATVLGLSDTVTITHVIAGSPAARAGLRPGDRLLMVDTVAIGTGARGHAQAVEALHRPASAIPASRVVVRRGPALRTVSPEDEATPFAPVADTAASAVDTVTLGALERFCPIPALALPEQIFNAWTDGREVVMTTAMMRFGSDDELRVVLAHEYAHAVEGHSDKKMKNLATGFVFGLLLDIFARSQGDTSLTFSADLASAAAGRFSQEFEHEADYVGMYLLAQVGDAYERAPAFWRRMAMEDPGQITYATTHPTTAARFARMRQAAAEIARKRAAGERLEPERKDKATPVDSVGASP